MGSSGRMASCRPARRWSGSCTRTALCLLLCLASLGVHLGCGGVVPAAATEDTLKNRWHRECNSDGAAEGDLSVRPSTITGAGLGVFAERAFRAGEVLAFYTGIPIVLPLGCKRDCYESRYRHLGPTDYFDYVHYVRPLNRTHYHAVVADADLCPGLLSGMINSHTLAEGNNVAYGPGIIYARAAEDADTVYRSITMGHPALRDMWAHHPLYREAELEIQAMGDDAGDSEIASVHERYLQHVWPSNSTHTPFVAIRDIAAGEEIFSDYGFHYWNARAEHSVSATRLLSLVFTEARALGKPKLLRDHPLLSALVEPLLSIREGGGDACVNVVGRRIRDRGDSIEDDFTDLSGADHRLPGWVTPISDGIVNRYFAAMADALKADVEAGVLDDWLGAMLLKLYARLGGLSFNPSSKLTPKLGLSDIDNDSVAAMAAFLDHDIRNTRGRLLFAAAREGRLAAAADFVALYIYLNMPLWCASSPGSGGLAMQAFLEQAANFMDQL